MDGMGRPRWVTADLIDNTEHGVGVSLVTPLQTGSTITIRGKLGEDGGDVQLRASIKWCVESANGTFRAGLEFLDGGSGSTNDNQQTVPSNADEVDCYEVMQLSQNADGDTIGRVFRMLAQRYHPDNVQTGSSELFIRLSQAYQTLSDPERRARYDARYRDGKRLQWKIFDQAQASTGSEAEKRKRQGILGLLYAKTLHDPEQGAMTVHTFEELLGCPREHLQAALWYLNGKGYIKRGDNGRYSITIQGFDQAEEHCLLPRRADRYLPQPEIEK